VSIGDGHSRSHAGKCSCASFRPALVQVSQYGDYQQLDQLRQRLQFAFIGLTTSAADDIFLINLIF
jgi:hypothetical protein